MAIATEHDVIPAEAGPVKRLTGDLGTRLAGLSALGFVAIVAMQNAVRGSSAPSMDASPETVLAHYADHRSITLVLVATFVLSGTGLAAFVGGTMRRLLAGGRPGWAISGGIGAVGVMALFALVIGSEQALSNVAAGDRPDLGSIEALWAFHNSVFTVLFLFLSIALLGLSRSGVAAGLTPRAFEYAGPAGAAMLAVGAMFGPAIAVGDAMPVFGLAGLGFLTWLAFLLTTGLRLARGRA